MTSSLSELPVATEMTSDPGGGMAATSEPLFFYLILNFIILLSFWHDIEVFNIKTTQGTKCASK